MEVAKRPVRQNATTNDTEEQDRTLNLFSGETYNSLTKAGSEEMIQQLNQ